MVDSKLKVKYREASTYRSVPATGVVGGPIATGDLLCNFFLEHRGLPEEVNVSIGESSKPVEEPVYREDKQIFIRELQVGIVMSPIIAKSVGEWLIRRAEEIMEMGSHVVH